MSTLLLLVSVSFVATFITIFVLAPIARRVGYIDTPGGRKNHQAHAIPIGGVAIFLVLAAGMLISLQSTQSLYLLAATALLVVSGAVDEYFELSVLPRVLIEFGASLIMVVGAGIILSHFGNLLGFGSINLIFPVGLLVTAIAVFGTINAWNMIDGVDGLAGTMAILSIASFLYITAGYESQPLALYLILGGLLAFLCFNFSSGQGLLPKVFLGDAGSKLIGFCFVWFLVQDTQSINSGLVPVTALYIMGLPIMDMTTTVVNRLRNGSSPFKPDRTHIHHILLDAGCSSLKTYTVIVATALLVNVIGVLFHQYQAPEPLQFFVYLTFFVIYFALISIRKKAYAASLNPVRSIS